MENYLESCLDEIREQVGDARVLLGLSGGVDSSVCAALLARAVPGQLTCIYVDHGLMREGESRQVREAFRGMDLDPAVCRRRGPVTGSAGRGDGAGSEAENHWAPVRPGF